MDRSAAYAARYVAKNVVAAGLADRAEIQISYAIGIANPISISAETFGTNKVPDSRINSLIEKHFDLRPGAIIRHLDSASSHLLQDRRLRPLRKAGGGLPLGATDKAEVLRREAFVSDVGASASSSRAWR